MAGGRGRWPFDLGRVRGARGAWSWPGPLRPRPRRVPVRPRASVRALRRGCAWQRNAYTRFRKSYTRRGGDRVYSTPRTLDRKSAHLGTLDGLISTGCVHSIARIVHSTRKPVECTQTRRIRVHPIAGFVHSISELVHSISEIVHWTRRPVECTRACPPRRRAASLRRPCAAPLRWRRLAAQRRRARGIVAHENRISSKIPLASRRCGAHNSRAASRGVRNGGRSSVGRATDRGSVGRGFETLRPPHSIEYGSLAQLVEQGTLNPKVQGSNP